VTAALPKGRQGAAAAMALAVSQHQPWHARPAPCTSPHRHAEKATEAQCELAHCTTVWQLVVVRRDVDTLLVHADDGVHNIHRLLWRLLWWAPDWVRATWVWVPATWVRWIRVWVLAFSISRLRSRSGVSRVKVGERTCLCAISGGNLFTPISRLRRNGKNCL
jgi:hypothetical protein